MTKDANVHGDSKDAAERLKKMKGENAPSRPAADAAGAVNPWERPADRMMAAQADVVDARREAFARLRLEDAHAQNVRPFQAVGEPVDRHEAAIAAERLAARADVPVPETLQAPDRKKKPAEYALDDDRPAPEFDVPSYEDARVERKEAPDE